VERFINAVGSFSEEQQQVLRLVNNGVMLVWSRSSEEVGTGKYSLHLLSDIVASRLPVVLLSSLLPVFIYYFGKKFHIHL